MQNRDAPSKRQFFIALALTAPLLLGAVFMMARRSDLARYDFISIYTPAFLMREGLGKGIYDPLTQARVQESIRKQSGVLLGIHPPFELAVFAPITKLGYVGAYAVLGVINVALWMLFVCIIRPYAPIAKDPQRYLLLCFTFFPAWVALLQGQTSLALLVAWAATFVFMKRRMDFWAGVFLGLCLMKFPMVLPFALICFLRGKVKVLLGFVSAASLLGIVSIAAIGVSGVQTYVNLLLDITKNPMNPPYWGISPANMPTLQGLLSALLGANAPFRTLHLASTLISLLLVGFMAWRWRREDSADGGSFNLMFAASLVASEVAAPYLYTHDLTPTLLAMLLVIRSAELSRSSVWRWIVTVSVVLLYLPVYPFLVPRGALFLIAPVLLAFALATSMVPSAQAGEVKGAFEPRLS